MAHLWGITSSMTDECLIIKKLMLTRLNLALKTFETIKCDAYFEIRSAICILKHSQNPPENSNRPFPHGKSGTPFFSENLSY